MEAGTEFVKFLEGYVNVHVANSMERAQKETSKKTYERENSRKGRNSNTFY